MPFGVLSSLCNYEVTRRIREIILGVNPTYIPGCQYWFDAADATTIITSGGNIIQWSDKSGFGRHATQYNTSSATYSTNGFNGLPTVVFGGATPGYSAPSPVGTFPKGNSVTVFVVFSAAATQTQPNSVTLVNKTVNNLSDPWDFYRYNRFVGSFNNIQNQISTINFNNCTSPGIYDFTIDGSTSPILNEYLFGGSGSGATYFTSAAYSNQAYDICGTKLLIGTRHDNQTGFNGNISEIIVYNTALQTGARQLIEGYLAAKWGLQSQLPTTHPYYSAQPNMYFPQLPLWWYKFLASDISYSSPTSTFVAYNYGTQQFDGSMNGWAVTGPTDGLAIDNAANLGVEPSALRFGNGTPYMTTTTSNTQWMQWPSISSVSNYYTLAYVLKYADTTAPARWQQHWTMNSATNYNNPNGLTVTNYYNSGTSLVWWNAPNSIFNMANVLDGNPHHFTFIFGPSNFQPQIYLDASALLVPSSLTGPYNTITSNILGFNYCNWNNQFINAWLGETRLYNFAMTPTQVNTLYNLMMDYTVPQPPITITGVTAISGNVYSTGTSTTNGVQYAVYAFTSSTTNPAVPQYTINYNCSTATQCFVFAVAGGGGGGGFAGGGGGGGGVVMTPVNLSTGSGSITVAVGAGSPGTTTSTIGPSGYNTVVNFSGSTISNITAIGGGAGGGNLAGFDSGNAITSGSGASSGGGGYWGGFNGSSVGISSNVGMNYGNTSGIICGGGGGAGTAGTTGTKIAGGGYGGNGGSGIQCFLPGIKDFTITSTVTNTAYIVSTLYWGGGGGGSSVNSYGTNMCMGGVGGGGGGANHATSGSGYSPGGAGLNTGQNGQILDASGGNGGINTGGGGGGGGNLSTSKGGNGGSGIVIIAFPQTEPVTAPTNSVLTNPNLSSGAYNSLCGAFACNLVNYNYYGPMMTLRVPTDTNGTSTTNFYADTYGNMGTGYMGTGTSINSWIATVGIQNINGCVIWLDAASSSTITTASGKVSQWVDKTSNAFTFTQSTDGNRPTYVTNSLNGLPTLQFTKANANYLGGPTNFEVGTNSFSLFVVCKFNDTTSAGGIFNKSLFGDASGRILIVRESVPASKMNILVTDNFNSNLPFIDSYAGNTYRILELIYNRTEGKTSVYNNGTLVISNTTTDSSYLTNNYNMIIGGYNDGSGNITPPHPDFYLDGNIAEIVAFSNPYDMTTTTRQQIEGYLANKWGLQSMLPMNHPAYNGSYAFVTKWYNQGMDFSFNCATQYTTTSQPIYDINFKLLNFGYHGWGGGVMAPQMNCYFNLPDYAMPYGDSPYTITIKHVNTNNPNSSVGFFSGGNFAANTMNFLWYTGSSYNNAWYLNASYADYSYKNNNIVTCKYTGSVGTRTMYINQVTYDGTGPYYTRIQDPSRNYIGVIPNILGYDVYGNHQQYYMYIFGTALSDQDRTIVENVNYYNSINNIISDTNLIMYYPMESSDISNGYLANWAFGSPVYDASMVNGPSLVENSRIVGGSAMSFSAASSQYLKLPDFTPTTNGLSFSVWYNSTNTGSWGRIFDFGNGSGFYNIFISPTNYITNKLNLTLYGNGGSALTSITLDDPSYNDSTWRHVVWTLTYDVSYNPGSTWKVYINGQLNKYSTTSYYPDTTVIRRMNYIGKSNWSADASYNGYIDDFRVYNRVLSAAEVSQLYYAQGWNYIPKQIQTIKNSVSLVSTYLLTMYYPMEPADISGGIYLANWALGTPIYDVSLVNAPTLSTNSRIVGGSSMQFTAASSQYLRLPNFTPTNNGLTFSVWYNSVNTGRYGRIFEFGTDVANASSIVISSNSNNTNYLDFELFGKTSVLNYIILDDSNYNDGKWRHIVWTLSYDISSNPGSKWNIYVNGILHPKSITNGFYPDTTVTRTYNYIGKSTNSADAYYNGYIDDFRVYNRVLTTLEVKQLYYSQGINYIPQYVNLYYNSISTISTNGLVMYYPMEATDTSGGYLANWALGTPIYDSSMVNSPTTSTDMKVVGSSAMRFISANSQYLTLPNFTPTNNGLTFSFWINSNNSTTYATIFDFGHQFTNTNNIVCAVNNNSILALYSYLGTDISNAYDLGPYNTSYWPSTIIPDITARWIWIAPVPYARSMYPQARFIKTFTSATSYTGILYYAIDDWGDIYMNGQRLISFTGGGYTGTILTISINVVVGTNTLTINLCNSGGGPAGLIAALYDNNSNLVLHTDSTWNFYKYYTTYTSNDGYSTTLTKNINDNTWHHVVWSMSVADASYSTLWNIYVDSSNVYSNTFLNSNGYRYPYTSTMINNYISGTVDSTNINNALFAYNNGYIDDFRVYNRVLSAAEVQTLYAAQGANYVPQSLNTFVSGLKYNTFTNNTGTYQFCWVNPGHTNFDNSLTFFKQAGIPAYSGTVTYIDINNISATPTTLCGLSFYTSSGTGYPQDSAIQFTGYFYAPTTGTYTFSLGDITSYKSNDDISVFWIGTAGTSIYNFLSTVTESGTASPTGTGPSFQVTYNSSGSSSNFSNCQYSISLTAGNYYPIILSWGQSFGGAVLGLGITPPGGSLTYNGTGYFYSSP